MENNIFKEIISYIDFLRGLGYKCVLSHFDTRFEPYTQELYLYEVHLSSVCYYLKQSKATEGRCHLQKMKLNSMDFDSPFYSSCYAGVEEYIFPVLFEGNDIMRIHISGYRDTLKKSLYCKEKTRKMCDVGFIKAYSELSPNPPSMDEALSFVKPLEYMIIELYKYCRQNNQVISETKKLYLRAMEIINKSYQEKITVDSIAREMNYSPSYLRYIFKKEGDTTPNKQINAVRLENAKYLLLNTNLSVTEISFRCGFVDSNYFSTVFKERYGHPPKAYKRLNA